MKKCLKRALPLFLAIIMVFSMVPAFVFNTSADTIIDIKGVQKLVCKGDKSTIRVSIDPKTASQECIFTSDDPDVIVIDSVTGEWEALATGTAKIIIESVDGNFETEEYEITVREPLTVFTSPDDTEIKFAAFNHGPNNGSEDPEEIIYWADRPAGDDARFITDPDNFTRAGKFFNTWNFLYIDLGDWYDVNKISITTPEDRSITPVTDLNGDVVDDFNYNSMEQKFDVFGSEKVGIEEYDWWNNVGHNGLWNGGVSEAWDRLTFFNENDDDYLIVSDGTNNAYKMDKYLTTPKKVRLILVKGYWSTMLNIQIAGVEEVEELVILEQPTKTDYIEGQKFDAEGMVVGLKSIGGSVEVISDYKIDDSALATKGDNQKVKISVTLGSDRFNELNGKSIKQEFTEEISCTVAEKSLEFVKFDRLPTKKIYYTGEEFDPAGMVVNGVYDSGVEVLIPQTDYEWDATVFNTAGDEITVTVTYKDFDPISFTVKVIQVAATHIEVTTPPTKQDYIVGERFVPAGMVVSLVYNNGDKDILDEDDYIVEIKDELTVDDVQVKISYEGYDDIFYTITIFPEIAIEMNIDFENAKLEYFIDESFDTESIVITVKYNTGREATIASDDEKLFVSPAVLRVEGDEIEVTITYESLSTKVKVKVTEYKVVLKGDVNGDGSVTITDAIAIFRHLADKVKITDKDAIWAADIDGSGKIEILDAINIFRYLADKMTIDELQELYLKTEEIIDDGDDEIISPQTLVDFA